MAFAKPNVIPRQIMILIFCWKFLLVYKKIKHFLKLLWRMPWLFQGTLVVFLELPSVTNLKH